jgi:pimeloyl-ACP methyl ester carboxylesterase
MSGLAITAATGTTIWTSRPASRGGMADRTLPYKTCTGWFREALPDAEWIELPDCGHLSQHDDPELVARTILEVTTARAPEAAAA